MNRYVRAFFIVPFSVAKVMFIKMFHIKTVKISVPCMISPRTEISVDRGGKLTIGKMFKMRDGSKLRVRTGAECIIGDNTSMNCNNIIACREKVIIGNNVQFSPNVQIYDHDHDFRHPDGLAANHFKTSPVVIGNNVWVGANTVILRGTTIGDGTVIGAGSLVKGDIPKDSVFIQKRQTI